MIKNLLDRTLERLDESSLRVLNPHGVPITLFASEQVPIEVEAIEQILEVASIAATLESLGRLPGGFFGDQGAALERIVLTPDFHRGGGIPVGTVLAARGFVLPQAVGNDVCCGMRLLVTDLDHELLLPHLDSLERVLRSVFFEGRREILMSPRQREALLRDGLWGILETVADNQGEGIWRFYDPVEQESDLMRVHFQGVLEARDLFNYDAYIAGSGVQSSHDAQAGSVGGGNHFVEIQVVEDILDGGIAHAWGVGRGKVALMVHSGSVGLGHAVGGYFKEQAMSLFPTTLRHPEHGFFMIPTSGPHAAIASRYLDAMRNAANFAFGNRLFLGLLALRSLGEVMGRPVGSRLVHDAPHNLIWEGEGGPGVHLHRKGACPAGGPSPGPFEFTGQPVIIPGSMGDSSYLMAGQGHPGSLQSACHGAGRRISRGKARRNPESKEMVDKLRIVSPIDPRSPRLRNRRDILAEYESRLVEESPWCYKDVDPVVGTVETAGIARRIARLRPLVTVKG